MAWHRATVAQAIAATLTAAVEGTVAVFAEPPPSFNVPAYIVAWPTSVLYSVPTFGTDQATLPIIVAVPTEQSDQMDAMLDTAKVALSADATLGGLLAHGTVVVREQRNWRVVDVTGTRFLFAELITEIRQ